ncbi:MAG: glycerophosphodiester phosphodiesterase [Chloroflexi bacterium]|nr:glycerophosphodiester phosphodiesterase [Chloroflexota bacterium]
MQKTLNIAHRGARSLAPENTLAAARKAFEIGADMWELDVARSADGELFVLHDDTLERTSNAAEVFPDRRPWRAGDFALAEIRRLDFGSWFNRRDPFGQIAAGQVSEAEQRAFVGERAPTLREALLFTRDRAWRVNVEIKDHTGFPADRVIVEQVVAMIDELGLAGSVLLSSFNHAYLTRAKAVNSRLPLAALVETPQANPAGMLLRLGVPAYNPDVALTNPEEVARLCEMGFQVYLWTVNEIEPMRAFARAGAAGIITDFPQRFKEVQAGS